MTSLRVLFASIGFVCVSAGAAEPSASPSASASPEVTLTQSVADLSAQRAAAERSKIYQAGVAYSHWLDNVAKNSGSALLQWPLFDRVTWMRLLTSAVAIALLSIFAGAVLRIVRRRAGEIQSSRPQSWLELSASAIRKPFAFLLVVCGGGFALMPIATGIVSRPTRLFWLRALTGLLYAGWIIALLWLVFRGIRAVEKRMQLWAERTSSLLGKVIVPILGHTLRFASAAEIAGELDLGDAERFRNSTYRRALGPDHSRHQRRAVGALEPIPNGRGG